MATSLKVKSFDAAEFLDTNEAVAAFLADALDSGDAGVFQEALQTAARARGMSEVAEAAGLGRESLYKALRPDAQPRFDTVQKVMVALGVRLNVCAPVAKTGKTVTVKKYKRARSGESLVVKAATKKAPTPRSKTARE